MILACRSGTSGLGQPGLPGEEGLSGFFGGSGFGFGGHGDGGHGFEGALFDFCLLFLVLFLLPFDEVAVLFDGAFLLHEGAEGAQGSEEAEGVDDVEHFGHGGPPCGVITVGRICRGARLVKSKRKGSTGVEGFLQEWTFFCLQVVCGEWRVL